MEGSPFLFYFIFQILFAYTYQAVSPSGSVELDEFSFNKVIKKFDAALVKFDVAYPYGDKHEAFVSLAKETKDVEELLIAEVDVKDYGDKDNEALAKKYGATKDNFPVVKLFLKTKEEPITFDESSGFTTDALRKFVRENTGLYLNMPGCIKELDKLAETFMKSQSDERQKLLKEVEIIQKSLKSKDEPSGKIYRMIMEKIIVKGDEFVQTELARVKKLLSEKVSDEKKKELSIRVNILQAFQLLGKIQKKQEL